MSMHQSASSFDPLHEDYGSRPQTSNSVISERQEKKYNSNSSSPIHSTDQSNSAFDFINSNDVSGSSTIKATSPFPEIDDFVHKMLHTDEKKQPEIEISGPSSENDTPPEVPPFTPSPQPPEVSPRQPVTPISTPSSHSIQSQSPAIVQPTQPTLPPPQIKQLPTIKPHSTREARILNDQLADLYSLLVTMEHLETAYVRDAIDTNTYTKQCGKLIAQYKTLKDSLANDVTDLERFCREYHLSARSAMNRFKAGIPATIVHGDHSQSAGQELSVFHSVQHFITAMDSLKLNMKAVDELYPNLTDLMDSISKVPQLPSDHLASMKVKHWLMVLSSMRASDELSDEQVRQMSFDLDSAYNAFHKFVSDKGK